MITAGHTKDIVFSPRRPLGGFQIVQAVEYRAEGGTAKVQTGQQL